MLSPLWIPIILGVGLYGLWMATGWDTQDQRFLLWLVNWLILIGLYFDLLWIVWVATGIGFQNLAIIGIALLIMMWTILKDWNTPREF
jgi:multisubunit Na+/H+ antiporter MnhB subunit